MASGLEGARKRSICEWSWGWGDVCGEGGEETGERWTLFYIYGEVKQTCDRGTGGHFAGLTQELGTVAIATDSTMSLFTPDDPHGTSRLFRFMREVNEKHSLNLGSYQDLYHWSTSNIDLFWSQVWDHTQIIGGKGEHIVDATAAPAKNPAWFPESVVNFAENLLSNRSPDTAAIVQVCTLLIICAARSSWQ